MKRTLFIPAILSVLGVATTAQTWPSVGFGFNINVPLARPQYHMVHEPIHRRIIIEQPETVIVRRPARVIHRTYAMPATRTIHCCRPSPSVSFGFGMGNGCRWF